MPNILLAWELGGGLGHVQRLVAIARELARLGHRPLLAVRNIVEPSAVLGAADFPFVQAPLWQPRPISSAKPFRAVSYADILTYHGYARAEDLQPMVLAWRRLIELVQPALIVADHAPTVCLAAFQEWPVVTVGNGFALPPVEAATFPLLLTTGEELVRQESLLDVVQRVQQRIGRPAPPDLTDILRTSDRVILTSRELDPYRARRQEPVAGPLETCELMEDVPAEPRYFAYLAAAFPPVVAVLESLCMAGLQGELFLRDAPTELRDQLRRLGLLLHDEPPTAPEALGRCRVVLHHGGHGLSELALAAGRPQVLLPRHLEQTLTAQALTDLGVGRGLSGRVHIRDITAAVRELSDHRQLAAARDVARRLERRAAGDPLQRIVQRCREVLG